MHVHILRITITTTMISDDHVVTMMIMTDAYNDDGEDHDGLTPSLGRRKGSQHTTP